jgi:hypothetical protein
MATQPHNIMNLLEKFETKKNPGNKEGKKISKNRQISVFGFLCVARNIEG